MKVELLNTCRSEFDALDPYLKESIEKLKKYGFQFEILPSYASAQLRAQQFVAATQREDVDYSWIARGGMETAYLLPYLDFSNISIKNTFIGSSDFTHLAIPMVARGAKVFYGSGIRDVSKNLNDVEISSLAEQLKRGADNSLLPLCSINNKDVETDKLIGGTLQILLNLIGTSYAPDLKRRNVFIEHHYIPGEGYLEAKYWLNALKLKLDFKRFNCLLVGELVYLDGEKPASQEKQLELINEVFEDTDIPVAAVLSSHRKTLIQLG